MNIVDGFHENCKDNEEEDAYRYRIETFTPSKSLCFYSWSLLLLPSWFVETPKPGQDERVKPNTSEGDCENPLKTRGLNT